MIELDFTRPYSTHDAGSNALTRFMQDGNKFDINGNLLGPDGRGLDAIEDVEALFVEPAFTEEAIVVVPELEVIKPKTRTKAKTKPAVEEQTEIDDLA